MCLAKIKPLKNPETDSHCSWILRYAQNDGVKMVLTLKSPAAAPSSTVKAGVFGEDCLSEASSAAARFDEAAQEISGRG